MESRNGNDRAMPAPWRKRRRDIGRRVVTNGAVTGAFAGGFIMVA
jgi:hypothetical protein